MQERVQHRADRHRRENCPRQISFRISCLTGELNRLLEPLQSENDATRQRSEDAMKTERHKSSAGMEVGGIELEPGDDRDGENGDGRLPDHNDHVAVG